MSQQLRLIQLEQTKEKATL